ncbi:hypothetical protein SAMN05444483_10214 [Salegentibacter echinorum]|uniref:Uncharacterized protein n=1 Tax=Salegentibacter echinorum TaxID=1073325 RepID=A0A1M5DLZ4_SALEC|nr:hypothetical protein [Salegentibacter echinorum]SHF67792.1 hypothetical protein SAMN05444483_10214 [Salegentibacter echinorum]
MTIRSIIEAIDKSQRDTLVSLTDFRGRGRGKGTEILSSRSRGLYWLWCKTPLDQLKQTDHKGGAHVPIKKLLHNRNGLDHICKIQDGEYRILYNGMGGYSKCKKGSAYGLRGRINQEVISNNTKTGTINIAGLKLDINDWKVSFFDFDDAENHQLLRELPETAKLDIGEIYKKYANELEMLWRMHYGTPILCRY